jgi:hypothetical protein
MRLFRLSEFVGTQEGGDHVDADEQGPEAVDQLHKHGSDPLQADGVEDEDADDGEAGGDVEDIGHGRSLANLAGDVGRKAVRRPFRSWAALIRDS